LQSGTFVVAIAVTEVTVAVAGSIIVDVTKVLRTFVVTCVVVTVAPMISTFVLGVVTTAVASLVIAGSWEVEVTVTEGRVLVTSIVTGGSWVVPVIVKVGPVTMEMLVDSGSLVDTVTITRKVLRVPAVTVDWVEVAVAHVAGAVTVW